MATKEQEMTVPTQFPPEQMFVAVSESAGEFAGHDGGPKQGGRGLWPKGAVGQWTARGAVPLALRDPQTGLIWKGYLEPVVTMGYGQNNVPICLESQQFYAVPGSAEKPKPKAIEVKAAKPTGKAAERAKKGPARIGEGVQGLYQTGASPLANSVGGRVSDQSVG